jgi:hypothetical protein
MKNVKENYIKEMWGIENEVFEGRNIQEGYQRGWGIKYGGLIDKVSSDPDFDACYKLIGDRSIVAYEKLVNIFLILKFYLPNILKTNTKEAGIIEFGSYKGGGAIFMAAVAKRLQLPLKVYGLDTFAGMPATDKKIDAHNSGDFKDVDLEKLNSYKKQIKLDNLTFVKGLFQSTATMILDEIKKVALTHIDCDIYEAVKFSYEIVKPYMLNGGYYIFDDATEPSCIGATSAVEKFVVRRDGLNSEQIYPHFVFRNSDK